ncbi:MAG: CvpA family protein [candidate division Zixibacteria bacterium]|nr:CvpA family protein [candidate division Zixibacteria bacterium]
MNWIDAGLIVLLLASVIVGSKKGLVRELSAFVVFFAALLTSITYIDTFAVWMYQHIGGSPLLSAFVSFVLLLAVSYAVFKLLGLLFYKIASLKNQGKPDQIGGALVGFLRGWVAVGFLTFLVFLLPMPDKFYNYFGSSFFGPVVAKTVPFVYESTTAVHPQNPSFMKKIENTLLMAPAPSSKAGSPKISEDRAEVLRTIRQLDRFFNTSNTATDQS